MKTSNAGFTLIELLVVVGIMAILAVIGIAIYSKTLVSTRDAKRIADIDAIAKALESGYSSGAYLTLTAASFVNVTGQATPAIPKDPMDSDISGCKNRPCMYCFKSAESAAQYGCVSGDSPSFTGGSSFKVCANLEAGGSYCLQNRQ